MFKILSYVCLSTEVQGVPLVTEPGISLIILTPIKILQRNLNRSTFVVWEMKRRVSVVCVCSAPNCCDTEQWSASQPGSVVSGTPYIYIMFLISHVWHEYKIKIYAQQKQNKSFKHNSYYKKNITLYSYGSWFTMNHHQAFVQNL